MKWLKRLLYKMNRLKHPVSVSIKTWEPSLNERYIDIYVRDKRTLKKYFKMFLDSCNDESDIDYIKFRKER